MGMGQTYTWVPSYVLLKAAASDVSFSYQNGVKVLTSVRPPAGRLAQI